MGFRTIKAFGAKSRFFHCEFFQLNEDKPGLGKKGDYVALEVNMRPAGGYTPDMINYANSVDCYQIWADMVCYDEVRSLDLNGHKYFCVYAGRRDCHQYKHTHAQILARYGSRIKMCGRIPQALRKIVGDFIFGISFMFLGLGTLRQTGIDMDLAHNQPVLDFFASFDPHSFTTTITFLLIGSVLTMCVQSSAAVMAITMILCSTGVLPIYQGIALVMGENIGTTVTSNVAALTANTQARRAAMGHMVFNVFGVLWILCVFRPFIHLVCGWVGFDDVMEKNDPHFVANAAKLSFVLAAFHTTFNLSNTFILVWFIPQIEKLVCKIIRPKKNADEDDFRLRFIQSGIMKTPEISVLEAQKEIHSFAVRIQRMFGMVKELLGETNDDKFVKLYTRIEKYEGISDNMEIEIAKYLDQVSDSHLSDETKAKIRAMLREISEIESIGDSCFNIARTLNRRIRGKEDFIPSQYEHMHQMMELTDNALTQMNITLVGHKGDNDANLSFNIENEINNYRNQLKSQNINDVNNHLYTYAIGTMYMDIIQECEKLGDYVVNVVEARMGVRQHEA